MHIDEATVPFQDINHQQNNNEMINFSLNKYLSINNNKIIQKKPLQFNVIHRSQRKSFYFGRQLNIIANLTSIATKRQMQW